jgi:hypothetical protein
MLHCRLKPSVVIEALRDHGPDIWRLGVLNSFDLKSVESDEKNRSNEREEKGAMRKRKL